MPTRLVILEFGIQIRPPRHQIDFFCQTLAGCRVEIALQKLIGWSCV